MGETLAVAMVLAVCALLLLGYPVAFTLAGVSLGFAAAGGALGVVNLALLGALPERIFGIITNDVLLAIPLFIFMGVMLERSRIAEELLEPWAGCSAYCRAASACRSSSSAFCSPPPKAWSARRPSRAADHVAARLR